MMHEHGDKVGLKIKKYLHTTRKRFDPLALTVSTFGILAIVFSLGGVDTKDYFFDLRSIIVVVGGTFAILLFQFDFSSTLHCCLLVLRSFFGTPDRNLWGVVNQLNDAIISHTPLTELRQAETINGELLNDIIYMHNQGLVFEEIDEFVTSRLADDCLSRSIAVSVLSRGAVVAPALGLFGTVMGLIGVLKSLTEPSAIGPSMSLALMTTAYGAALGTLIFTPLAGRIEHHNGIHIEIHKQILAKISILLQREDKRMEIRNFQEIA